MKIYKIAQNKIKSLIWICNPDVNIRAFEMH